MLALTVALVGPYFVDWTSYRADFEREAGRILGRNVSVEGTATARLLPFPSVTFTDVVVAGMQPGEPAMTVETFSMDAELAPFMRGDVHIFDMRLVRPSILIDVADDGALDWAVRPSVPVNAGHISLEKLTITEGRVTLRHAMSGRSHTLTEINGDVSARSLAGPWRMEGSLRLDGMLTALTVTTGAVDQGEGMRLRVRARPERYPISLEADGNARIEDGRAQYAGQFRLDTVQDEATPRQTAETAPAYRLSGLFDFDHAALKIEEFRLETGPLDDPYTAEGSAEFELGTKPRFLIRADGAQIRIDDLAQEAGEGIAFERRLAAFRDFLLDTPRPAIPGRIEVALPAIVAGDTTIRDVHLSAEPAESGWTIASLGATLPGRATLEARGDLAVGEELGFAGSLLLAVGQPSGFATWLARDVDDAIRRLPAAGFSADVELTPERQSFRDLELMLGAARFTGEIESRTPADEKPSMTLRFDGDRLDVEGMAAFASLFVSDRGQARLADRNLEFEISAGPVTAAGLTAETVDTALRLRDGLLEIDRLAIGGLAGANVSATGSFQGVGGEPLGNIDATVVAADLAPLAETLVERFPDNLLAQAVARRVRNYPGLLEDASVHLRAGTAARADGALSLSLSAEGEAGGTTFALAASSDDARRGLSETPLTLELSAGSDEVAALFALAGLPAVPLGLAGPAEAQLSFDGVVEEGGWGRLGLSGEGLDFSFEGAVALDDGALSANGAADIESGDIEPWLAAAGVPLPGFGYGLPVRLSAELDTDGELLMLSNFSGEVAGAAVSGDINAQIRDGLPHLTGSLSLRTFDLATVAELAVGAEALGAAEGGWPSAAFAQTIATPATTELDLVVERLRAGSFAELADARFTLRLGTEAVSVSNLHAGLHGGTLSGIVDFRNDAGTGLLSSQLRLAGSRARDLARGNGIAGTLDMTASVTASGKSIDGLVAALAGSGTASLRGLSIEGIDPFALPDILEASDTHGPEIDAAATDALAADRVREGTFRADSVDIAFTVANGAVRAPPVRMERPEAVMTADLRADLRDGTIGAEALLTYLAGAESLVGSEPAVRFVAEGPLDDVRVEVDTAPLAQFLTQRALEAEQRRVDAMQAGLLERQRHRRELRYYASLEEERQGAAEEADREAREAERLDRQLRQIEEDAERRRLEEEETRRRAEERARREAEAAEAVRQAAAERERAMRNQEAEAAEAARQAAAEQERAERRQVEDDRLRAEVEALLGATVSVQDPEITDTVPDDAPIVVPPAVVGVVPTPRPSRSEAPAATPAADVPGGPVFSEDGFMRMLRGE